MKVYILIPFLFLVVACQNTAKEKPKAKTPEKTFNYSAFQKDYEEILEAILTHDTCISRLIITENPKTYIEDRFTKDSISTSYKGDYPPGDEIGIRELFNHLSSSRQDSINFLNQTRDRDTVYIPQPIAHKYVVKDSNRLTMEERFLTKLVFHLPILTHDGQKAFVSLDYLCGGWCGQGWYFILEKTNGKWKVVKYEGTWEA
ncbi:MULTISPECIES: hypothetical protein [Sphingobacterium]|uniref:hypothetical protein n=1 Tax=Sphingobacterium TaxID=28453 RepID=UPI00257A35A4|nr:MULTISPECIES: hypothetical protein [Sphingobacterium]